MSEHVCQDPEHCSDLVTSFIYEIARLTGHSVESVCTRLLSERDSNARLERQP